MSSGGSTGVPATPAPTPFSHGPGGVRPEELAAGISRYSQCSGAGTFWPEPGSGSSSDEKEKILNATDILCLRFNIDIRQIKKQILTITKKKIFFLVKLLFKIC